ncbi:probable E3 ubiquitin-protein ligase RHG1A isoform X2 [Cucurbita pepo subsp. pepo]|uniref:probable E3 ubiquitin-protein ligase RHG1A isoform X2 n=1 Tax=Cucurbita pepo subsp. pepo TaxID=3664 RepID=UPI000C9D29BB|nr:probable E3 ubiquitin-protein ligase RHG1A isoform X2 [Cucurbita pepo subsp. pepo]XP_023545720.1 probable E3 ubiquitin-protein ligase RHG1A isoform X2 [Cucurbita pepo subsp. pepo]XP_023545721.1 probable E3 ubiquitin-protein ligase RHG1A isoform X2 [Cucurbita pepo subsp. pepo]
MQGQRSSVGSLSETINFEHGSSSNNPGNQPVYWNNMWNPAENRIPDYLLPTPDVNSGYVSSVSHEQRSLSRWSLGEPSSCDMQTDLLPDEQKAELGWSSMTRDADGPFTENQLCEPSNNPSLGHVNLSPLIIQNSNSNSIPHTLNLNASFASHGGDSSRVNEGTNVYKSSGSEEGGILCSSASDPLLLPSGSSGLPMVANDGRASSSLEGRRAPCKRKSIEGNVAQSSLSGSSSYSQHIERGAEPPLPALPGRYNTGSRLSIPAPLARMNQAPIRGTGELMSNSFSESIVAENSDSSQRNYRIRISSSNAQDSFASVGTVVRHPRGPSSQPPARLLPAEHVLDLRPAAAVDNLSAQGQPIMIHVPALSRSLQPYRWIRSSTSRSGNSSSSAGERQVVQREEVRPNNMGRNVSEHPMFVPANELRNMVQNQSSRGLTSSSLPIPGNVASTSRVGSSSGVHPSSGPWIPPESSPTQFPRRLTEYVRRQLFSSATNESGGRINNYSQRSGSTLAQDMVLSSGSDRRGHHLLQPRSALRMERRGDGGLGLPYSLRTLATSNEGSDNNRLVSEQIRNVLGLVRRGESLRVEDVMILDQSLFFGMADMYDRHRDMRLDVDNMSYEELLALEERIGNVNTGLSEETIIGRLKQKKHVNAVESQVEEEPCCVCQEEYVEGDDMGTLECGHDFHTDCIKQWLMQKNLCPICKTTGIASRE